MLFAEKFAEKTRFRRESRFFIEIPVPDIPSDVYTWPKARHRLVYASDPGDIPVLPV